MAWWCEHNVYILYPIWAGMDEDEIDHRYGDYFRPKRREDIHIRVSPDAKARWEKHVESQFCEYGSLSGLIRGAVDKEVHGFNQRSEEQYDELISELAEVQQGIVEMNRGMQALRSENIEPERMETLLDETAGHILEYVKDEGDEDGRDA